MCLKSFHRKVQSSKIYFYIVLCIVGWSVELHNLLIRSLNYDWILSNCKFIYENCQQFNFFFERLGGRRKSGHAPVYRDVGRHLYPSNVDVGYMLCNLTVCMCVKKHLIWYWLNFVRSDSIFLFLSFESCVLKYDAL